MWPWVPSSLLNGACLFLAGCWASRSPFLGECAQEDSLASLKGRFGLDLVLMQGCLPTACQSVLTIQILWQKPSAAFDWWRRDWWKLCFVLFLFVFIMFTLLHLVIRFLFQSFKVPQSFWAWNGFQFTLKLCKWKTENEGRQCSMITKLRTLLLKKKCYLTIIPANVSHCRLSWGERDKRSKEQTRQQFFLSSIQVLSEI